MMSERDPFPMTSAEAQKLASSVESQDDAGDEGVQWGSMNMKTNSAQGLSSAGDKNGTAASSQSLTGKTKQMVKKGSSMSSGVGGHHGGGGVIDVNDECGDGDGDNGDDGFFDRSLDENRAWYNARKNPTQRLMYHTVKGSENIYHRLYGDELPISEMLRTLCLASTLFFMIGGYWLLRSLKDTIMITICGVQYIPKAKILSVFVVLGVVSFYNHLLDNPNIPRHKLFYIFGTFYFMLFTFIAFCLMNDTVGVNSVQQPSPYRVLGWISYCGIESFGSVMVSLFWSFANSSFSLETAKASYGVMVATAQVGSIIGPTIVNSYASQIGIGKCYLIGAMCMLLLQGSMYTYINIYGAAERNSSTATATDKHSKSKEPKTEKKKAGILEGLKLFYQHNYVKGIFAISCLFMVEVTIVDYTLKVLASDYFVEQYPCEPGMSCYHSSEHEEMNGMSEMASSGMAEFMGFFGQATNTLSLVLSFFGTSAIIRYLGLRLTLLLFPTLCLFVIIFVRFYPTLYAVFGAMICLKACSYALNNPTKEILYQPTSSAVRYKAKSWIDIFGARGSKAMGSLVTNAFSDSTASLVSNGSLVGMAVASFLIWNARFMGKLFDKYTAIGYVVGGDNTNIKEEDLGDYAAAAEDSNVEMAMKQNEAHDTSCGIYDDYETGHEEEGQEEDVSHQDEDEDDEDVEKAKTQMV